MIIRVNIAVASPSDVPMEREAIHRVFTRWNDASENVFLHPVMWEFASVPTMGDHPQHILNAKIIDKSDLLLGIFYSKLGTPTPTASSGTVEEIREFIAKKGAGRVMLYFCTRDLPHDIDAHELIKLREFKRQTRTEGLYHEFTSVDQFERDLYSHLDRKIDEYLRGDLLAPPTKEAQQKKTEKTEKNLPADRRLHKLIDFGNTLGSIASNFAVQMDRFDEINGVHPDKFYAFGAHVYASAAKCLDRCLTSGERIPEDDCRVLERISSLLKKLATNIPDSKAPFPDYWKRGREACDHLLAHVALMEKLKN